jgi:hypothetical protein
MRRVHQTIVVVGKQLVLHIPLRARLRVGMCVRARECLHARVRASVRGNICARVALLIQYAKRMRPIRLSSVASLAPQHFSTLSRKRHDFRNKIAEPKMFVLIFCTTFI